MAILKEYLKDTKLKKHIKILDELDKKVSVRKTKIKLFCTIHNYEFYKTAEQIKHRTHLCEKCRNQSISDSRTKNDIFHYLDFDNFEYELTDKQKTLKKVNVQTTFIKATCKKHGYSFRINLYNHSERSSGHKRGCKKCQSELMSSYKRKYKTLDDVLELIENKDGYEFELNYPNLIVKCPKHGVEIKPIKSLFRSHSACWACANEKMSKNTQMTWNEFVEITSEKYEENDISCDNWVGTKSKIKYNCKVHGIVEQSAIHRLYHNYQSDNGCPKCSLLTSKGEGEVLDYINSLGIKTKSSDRKLLSGKEIDILCEEQKLGIEFNGMHWHSEGYKSSLYHLEKLEKMNELGYELIQIMEVEWAFKRNIIKSILSARFGIFHNTVYARKTIRREITSKEASDFIEENHIQGFRSGNKYIGLFFDNELVSVAISSIDGELVRFCNKLFHNIIGGFSKSIKTLELKYSFVDKRLFSGKSYFKNKNFYLLYSTKPNYIYVKGLDTYSRQQFQKHKLKNKLKIFDSELTERENMINNNYRRLYDCGNYKFEYIN